MGIGNYSNGNGGSKWVQPLLLALLGILIPSGVALVTVSNFGSRYAERIDQQGANFSSALKQQGEQLANQISQLAASNGERSNALSARLNSQEAGVRDATVLAARQDQRLAAIENAITTGSARRDRQIEDLNKRIESLLDVITGGQVAAAKVEASVTQLTATVSQLITLLQGRPTIDGGPPARSGR
jgi:chromosome segregation ATPase